MKTRTLLLGLALLGGTAGVSFAQTSYETKTVYFDQLTGAKFKAKEKGTIDLGGWKRVEKLKVKVNGEIPGLRFYANSNEYVPTYIPTPRPYYEVNVGSAIDHLEVMADRDCAFQGGYLDVISHPISAPRGRLGGFYYGNAAAEELSVIEAGINILRYRFEDEKYIQYLRPIVDAINQAKIMEYSRGEIAQQSMNAIDSVIAQVDFAGDFLKTCLRIDDDRRIAIQLLSSKERLKMMRGN
jgi:hypothetical protein